MDAAEIVPRHIERHRSFQVPQFLAVPVAEAGKAP
jgi:hypothetical protein